MRRTSAIIFAAVTVFMLVFPRSGECRRGDNLYDRMSEKDTVKVYIADITDSSGKATADLEALRTALETALVTRMTVNFEMVPKKEDADVVINCDITEFFWTDQDPVDMVSGAVPLIWDVVNNDHYGRIRADFTVLYGAGHVKIWKDRIQANITHDTMTEEDSVNMLNERLVKVFMRNCFGKSYGKQLRM